MAKAHGGLDFKTFPIIFGLLKSNSHEAMSLLCIKFSTCSFLPISREPVYKLISRTSILRDRLIKCKRLAAVIGNFKDLVLMIQIQLEVPVLVNHGRTSNSILFLAQSMILPRVIILLTINEMKYSSLQLSVFEESIITSAG